MWVRDNNPDKFVALVTKDLNLRLKAKAVDMEVQDYLTDRVDDEAMDNMVREVICMEAEPEAMQSLAYGPTSSISWKEIAVKEPAPNQLYKFTFGGAIVLGRYDTIRNEIVLVKNHEACGIRPRNDEQRFAMDACMNPKIPLVSLTGGAGTGKTLIALAAAIEQAQEYDQIILSRPTVVLGGQDIGFLPGDQKSKMGPYVQPLMDNLDVIRHCFRPGSKQCQRIEAMLKEEKLVISPLAYIRGRSLGKVYFIVDEAQNLTPHEVKTIITRAGEGTKMVFTGDIFQIDQPYLDEWSNGLTHLGEKMAGQPLFEHIFLKKGERSQLSEIAAKLL
jgi:PhoH-like ATPase